MFVLVIDDPFDECKRTGFSYTDDQFEQLISDAEAFQAQKFLITISHIESDLDVQKTDFTALDISYNL